VSAIDLRLGRYQDALADVTCDLLCVDAPYSSKTHDSHSPRTDVLTACERDERWAARGGVRQTINYAAFTHEDVRAFVDSWAQRTRGWIVTITDNALAPVWSAQLREHDRYVFAPLPLVELGSRVRLTGDGPSSWTCWIVVARPHSLNKWGTLCGAYVEPDERKPIIGGKPLGIMRAIVRDYSRPGDVVCDPCAGGATTLLAAAIEGRRAIGSEMDPVTYAKAQARIARGYTPATLFAGVDASEQAEIDW
jgi:site-specific DNA-methyltransferase (adenine-specific)